MHCKTPDNQVTSTSIYHAALPPPPAGARISQKLVNKKCITMKTGLQRQVVTRYGNKFSFMILNMTAYFRWT